MSKLRIFGLGLLALMATGAFAVMNASANGGGGHFTSDAADGHTHIIGKESGTHVVHFRPHGGGLNERIGCDEDSYTATTLSNTVESLTITPAYGKCYTTNPEKTPVTIDVNGCTYTFTVTKGTVDSTEQEVHLVCPPGKAIEITHPNCNITVDPQSVKNAVTYTTLFENGKHTITLDVNATFKTTFHEKICILLGTENHFGELIGSVTVEGFNTAGNRLNITAT